MTTSSAVQAFNEFDFERNEAWQDYLKRVEIPTASPEALKKLKAKWYIRNIDATLDISDALGASTPQSTSASSQAKPEPAASARSEPPRQSTYTRAPPSSQTSSKEQHVLFFLHCLIIVCAVAYLIPVIPVLSNRAYKLILQVNIVASFIKIRTVHGFPSFRPLSGLKLWASRALPTTDFQYLMLCLVFLSHPSMTLLLIPILTLAVYHTFAYAQQRFSHTQLWRTHGARVYQWLGAKQTAALGVNAMAEVMLGFLLIFQLFTSARNFLLIYLYWNMLRMRFWAPDASMYHRQVWAMLDARTQPIRARVPMVQMPIAFVQKWFTSIGQQQR